jgi:hypothetical protein
MRYGIYRLERAREKISPIAPHNRHVRGHHGVLEHSTARAG